ncbi:spore germination protein [Salipaludibacillus sp. LMS25]|uniref:spore germination protein n=1 Tax=Salipaludibacillus sp. LMS25 TaxID=2924031 RepID=UPI0020D18353|nr:spore germination protein [Salipaludibacillus sp. LMS25]UTR14752.1 spore germination protein [Salipaludibacillus sp. LMS25]
MDKKTQQRETQLSLHVDDYRAYFKKVFAKAYDFQIRTIHTRQMTEVNLYYFNGLVDLTMLDELVAKSIVSIEKRSSLDPSDRIVSLTNHELPLNLEDIKKGLLNGQVLIHINAHPPYLLNINHDPSRQVTEPTTEYQVFGPKLGFVESVDNNIGILRYYLKDCELHTLEAFTGKENKMKIAIAYIYSLIDEASLTFINKKIDRLKNKEISTLGELARHFQHDVYSLFPQSVLTERPDHAKESLLDGKFVIFLGYHTFCIITPVQLLDTIGSSEDSSFTVSWNKLLIRVMRLLCMIIGTILPALYVALVAFHPELIPTTFTLTIAKSRAQIPITASFEALLMLFALDVLVEASIRLPSFVGQTIGIVGGLVIGTAAAEAGIVSNIMVVTIAFTAICTFVIPSWEFVFTWRIMRYIYVLVASFLGLYGLSLLFGLTFLHLCKLKAHDRPYLEPLSPFNFKKLRTFFHSRP